MGNKHTNSNNSTKLYNIIKEEIEYLIDNYKFWTNENICEKLTVVYHDKLMQYDRSVLLNASMDIGIENQDIKFDKSILCANIITHYVSKILLLQDILKAINRGKKRTILAVNGPVCQQVDSFIDDFYKCQELGGLWLSREQYNKIINNIINDARLDKQYMKYIKDLERYWIKYMKILQETVQTIKRDISNKMGKLEFETLKFQTEENIKKMDYICDIYYLLIVNYGY
jgi:hypothetical protein